MWRLYAEFEERRSVYASPDPTALQEEGRFGGCLEVQKIQIRHAFEYIHKLLSSWPTTLPKVMQLEMRERAEEMSLRFPVEHTGGQLEIA